MSWVYKITMNKKTKIGAWVLAISLLFGILASIPPVRFIAYIIYLNNTETTEFSVNNTELFINGYLNSKTYDQFMAIIEENPQIETLVEGDSMHGSTDDEIMFKLAYKVRELGLNTKILPDAVIESGAVDLFLAGKERIIVEGPDGKFPRIGVHSWSDGITDAKDFPKDSPEHEENRKYIEKMLGNDSFYWFTIYAAPANNIYKMSKDEVLEHNVATQVITLSD
jgi:hypothetical protein